MISLGMQLLLLLWHTTVSAAAPGRNQGQHPVPQGLTHKAQRGCQRWREYVLVQRPNTAALHLNLRTDGGRAGGREACTDWGACAAEAVAHMVGPEARAAACGTPLADPGREMSTRSLGLYRIVVGGVGEGRL